LDIRNQILGKENEILWLPRSYKSGSFKWNI
jgi:hypothetical protein